MREKVEMVLQVVSGHIGHAQPSTTLNIYVHYLPSADRLAADTIGQVLNRAQTVSAMSKLDELDELDNTIHPYSTENVDFLTAEKPENGGSPGARTLDLRIKSPLLYQLS
jgi:hypothetical protein